MQTIKIGMLGIGNIGKGTYQTLEINREKITQATGLDLEITKILNRHPEIDRGIDIPREKYVTDIKDVYNVFLAFIIMPILSFSRKFYF